MKKYIYWICNCCEMEDTRICNGDNSICAECGSVDDFREEE